MKKVCKKCGKEKDLECFRSGRRTCKRCEAESQKEYRACHREAVLEYKRRYREEHREDIQKQWQRYYAAHKEELSEKQRKYNSEHPERHRRYREKNRDNLRQKQKERLLKDPIYAFRRRQQNRVWRIFRRFGDAKKGRTDGMLGCTPENLYQHLIKTFEENYGYPWSNEYITEVHIDHIIPISSAKTIKEAKELFNYKNLQLLKSRDNLSKSNKVFATQGVAIMLSQKRRGEEIK